MTPVQLGLFPQLEMQPGLSSDERKALGLCVLHDCAAEVVGHVFTKYCPEDLHPVCAKHRDSFIALGWRAR